MSEPTLKELLRKRSGPCARDHCRKLRGQAADEIERLRAALLRIKTEPGDARDCRRIAAEAHSPTQEKEKGK